MKNEIPQYYIIEVQLPDGQVVWVENIEFCHMHFVSYKNSLVRITDRISYAVKFISLELASTLMKLVVVPAYPGCKVRVVDIRHLL